MASLRCPGDTNTTPSAGTYAYTEFFNPRWLDSQESLAEFRQSLPLPNPLADASFFSNAFIFSDPLHVLWRGICPSFVASTVIKLSRKGVWGMGNIQDRWDCAYDSACEFIKRASREKLSIDEFNSASMSVADGYPEMNAKGADIKSLCLWLAS
jgi:hypothetical protein